MARAILTIVLILLLNVLVGCRGVDTGASQLLPDRMKAAPVMQPPDTTESDIIEKVAINRHAYRSGIESLIAHYEKTGNEMKLAWAKDELKGLDKVRQYNYITETIVPPPDLRAEMAIANAELMYQDAVRLEKKAKTLGIFTNERRLRSALDKYNELIQKYPSSDRIDDAAYKAAKICEYFKDYTIALLYYQRTYQWDPQTIYPARYKAAYILDNFQHRRAEALRIYKEALRKDNLTKVQEELVQERIAELTKSDEKLE